MNKLLFEMFSLFMACAASALIGYIVAVIRHDRQLRRVTKDLIQEAKQAEDEFEDEETKLICMEIAELIKREMDELCNRMGQRV